MEGLTARDDAWLPKYFKSISAQVERKHQGLIHFA